MTLLLTERDREAKRLGHFSFYNSSGERSEDYQQ